jgi:YbgC/YbaW family acyl-CoA thioester hydrolase
MAEPDFESIVGVLRTDVSWGDCDPAGIIFYPTYFRWFDAATWALFGSVGRGVKTMIEGGYCMPLVGAQCEFVTPAEPGDRCEVRSRIARWGGKSFVVAHEVVRSDGTTLARGRETRVWGRHVAGPGSPMKGQPISEELKALFRAS